jgi:uncharacterized DUF497 family protein
MRFIWNEQKSRRNRAKHKVSFETAQMVFADPFALSILDRVVDGEARWQTLGLIAGVVVVLVAHTVEDREGEEVIRIISARKATSRERKIYESQGQKTN